MSHSPTAQYEQGTGSGRRTSPTLKSDPAGAPITRPSDAWPITSRSAPAGGQPYSPEMMSRSVPQTPIAGVSTFTDRCSGMRLRPTLQSSTASGSAGAFLDRPASPDRISANRVLAGPTISNTATDARTTVVTIGANCG